MRIQRMVLVLVAVLFLFGIPALPGEETKPAKKGEAEKRGLNSDKQDKTTTDKKPAILGFPTATPSEIATAFKYNDAAADEKFVKREVDVIARLEWISHVSDAKRIYPCWQDDAKKRADKYEYVARNSTGYDELLFFFTKDCRKALASLTPPEQIVTIRGYCPGFESRDEGGPWRTVTLHFYDCKIIGTEPVKKAEQSILLPKQ